MKHLLKDIEVIKEHGAILGGVLLISELATIFADPHKTAVYRRIKRLEDTNTLTRFIKGVYVMPDFSLEVLSQKISPESYISCETILADHLVIGTKPKCQVDAIKAGKTRIYRNDRYTLRLHGCAPALVFGYQNVNGINRATPEKALIDALHLHIHGVKFHFDPYSDVNWGRINKELVEIYLKEYKNQKFASFVRGVMNDTA